MSRVMAPMIAEAAKLYTQFQDDRPRRAKNFWSALVCIPAACLLASLRVAWTSAAGPPGDARLLARGDGALAGEPLGLFLEFGASGLNDLGIGENLDRGGCERSGCRHHTLYPAGRRTNAVLDSLTGFIIGRR